MFSRTKARLSEERIFNNINLKDKVMHRPNTPNGAALVYYNHIRNYVNNLSEEDKMVLIKHDANILVLFKNPSEALQLEAVKRIPQLISKIEIPSYEVQKTALSKDPTVLINIQNLHPSISLFADH